MKGRKVILTFDLPPQSQLRPKFSDRPFPHEYDPATTKRYKNRLNGMAAKLMAEMSEKAYEGSLEVRMTFYRDVQKSVSKKEHERRVSGRVLPDVKPDSDNYVKALWDAMNKALWKDDAQITDFSVRKRYSDHPRIEIEVLKIEG